MKVLEFSNWTDLQTQQMVLMPRLEEHGALVCCEDEEGEESLRHELHHVNGNDVYDWSLEDILVLLKREEPIRLHVSDSHEEDDEDDDDGIIEMIEEETLTAEEKKDCDDYSSPSSLLLLPFSPMNEFSSWTKRVVSETSKQVNKYKQQQQPPPQGAVSIFIQSNTGAFLSLQQHHEITNTSLLVVRKSATEPVRVSCQWYANGSDVDDDGAWGILPGATHTAFQPSADLAGHVLRCVVQMTDSTGMTCQTETQVQVLPTLFQGIRQATQKPTGYSSICMVNDITFRLSITRTGQEGCSAVRVERVLADHSIEVIHEKLVGVHASLASYDRPKDFQLHLPLSEHDDTLLYQLADPTTRVVSCQALNRMGREGFLIALGITNYAGSASSCRPSVLLYPASRAASSVVQSTTTPPSDSTTEPSAVVNDTPPTRPLTPPRSPIPFQRSTSLDSRTTHSPKEENEQLHELQRQNAELQKQNKQWLNEKAVLQAAIDARENKLELVKQELSQLQTKLEAQEKNDAERQDRRVVELQAAVEQLQKELREKDSVIATVQTECKALEEKYQQGQTIVDAHQQEHAALTMKLQKLKAERCHFKQKNESLQKEIAVICKNGRTIRQVEKLIADDAARQQEVLLLRQQKKDALTELEHYRTAYQETKHAQEMAGLDVNVTRLFERNAELERLVGELTEFVEAKESQLETVKQVNESLQAEIHSLAQAHMSNNDV